MVRLVWGVLSGGVLLGCLAGCTGVASPWRGLPPPPEVLQHAEPVWAHLAARRQALRDLKGLARVQVRAALHSAALDDVAVVVQPGEGLRLEGIGPLGQPLFLFLAQAEHLALYAPQQRRLLSGLASAENTQRLLGLALAPDTLQYLLVGDLPFVDLPTSGRLLYQRRDNLYRWDSDHTQHEVSYRVWFEPYGLEPIRFEMRNAPGELLLRVHYEDFQPHSDLRLPHRMRAEQAIAGQRITWQYTDVQLNTGVTPTLFQLRVPAGTEVIDLESVPGDRSPVLLRAQ